VTENNVQISQKIIDSSESSIENPKGEKVLKLVHNPLVFSFWKLANLPMSFLSRLKVDELTPSHGTVSVPYYFLNKNPFRSTYFAVLAMAAELSTGVLALYHTYGYNPSVSMLVANVEASFNKKATGRTFFTCHDGEKIFKAVKTTLKTGEGQTVQTETVGRNKEGDEIARFKITWSFKQRSKK